MFDGLIRNLLRAAVLLLFAGYFALTSLKTPFDFSDPEFVMPRSGLTQAEMVIANEPSDHFRTGAAALLLGLLLGHALLSSASGERRRFAIAILFSSILLAVSTFFGVTSLGTPLILLAIAIYGVCVAVGELKPGKGGGGAGPNGRFSRAQLLGTDTFKSQAVEGRSS
jgi:hypothetical protein